MRPSSGTYARDTCRHSAVQVSAHLGRACRWDVAGDQGRCATTRIVPAPSDRTPLARTTQSTRVVDTTVVDCTDSDARTFAPPVTTPTAVKLVLAMAGEIVTCTVAV